MSKDEARSRHTSAGASSSRLDTVSRSKDCLFFLYELSWPISTFLEIRFTRSQAHTDHQHSILLKEALNRERNLDEEIKHEHGER
jgi:hypothetical protein